MSSTHSRPDLDRMGGQALLEVFGTLLGLAATEVKPADEFATGTFDRHLMGTVKLTGDRISADVHLLMPRAFAEHAVVCLLGKNHPRPMRDAAVEDFAGELCNMLAGRVAARLRVEGYPCALDIPEVVRESPRLPGLDPGADCSRTAWSCRGHWLTLDMRCHYRPT
jgi:hypothetical protein